MGSVLCEHCTGHCCRYLALPIDKPTGKRDFDDLRWYLAHENVLIFVEDGDWYIQFTTPCRNLRADNRCAIYESRPAICREYSTSGCDYQPGEYEYDHLFTEPEQLQVFAKEYLKRRRAQSRRRRERRRLAAARLVPGRSGVVPLRLPTGVAV